MSRWLLATGSLLSTGLFSPVFALPSAASEDAFSSCDLTCSRSSEGKNVKRDPIPVSSGDKAVARRDATSEWWSNHYQWIVMVIVLILAFALITVAAVWLKRRHDAKYPHLYHASSRTSSAFLLNRQQQSPLPLPPPDQPGSFDPSIGMTEPRRFAGANTDSFASSAVTAVNSTRPGRSPFRSHNPGQSLSSGYGDNEIREVSR